MDYTFENEEFRRTYWHTCSHIMAQAVKRLWPEVKLAIGPSIQEGWYYDMLSPFAFTPEHMEQIEAEMRKIDAGNVLYDVADWQASKPVMPVFKSQRYGDKDVL